MTYHCGLVSECHGGGVKSVIYGRGVGRVSDIWEDYSERGLLGVFGASGIMLSRHG